MSSETPEHITTYLGKHVTLRQSRRKGSDIEVEGTIDKAERVPGMTITTDEGRFLAMRFRIKPANGSQAVWTHVADAYESRVREVVGDRLFDPKESTIERSSTDWLAITKAQVMDPDGWDRARLGESMAERITYSEFLRRLSRSTIRSPGTCWPSRSDGKCEASRCLLDHDPRSTPCDWDPEFGAMPHDR